MTICNRVVAVEDTQAVVRQLVAEFRVLVGERAARADPLIRRSARVVGSARSLTHVQVRSRPCSPPPWRNAG